jgi:hypothetical protein
MTKRLFLNDDHLVAQSPYDPEEVADIKQIDGAKWDKLAKVWRIPMTSLAETRDFATKHGFTIETDVLTFDLPEPLNKVFGVRKDGDYIYLSFAYDPVKVKAVKQIPSITWHAKTKAWRAPVSSISEVLAWAELFREPVEAELVELAEEIKNRHNISVQMSRSTEADLDVAGLPLLPYQRAGVAYASNVRRCFIADDMGLGKACTMDTMILTPTGWTNHGEIKVGDTVVGSDGKPIRVLGVYPQGTTRVLRVTFTDGTHADVNPEHLWNVQDTNMRKRDGQWKTLSTEQMLHGGASSAGRYEFETHYKRPNGDCRWYIPMVEPVEMTSVPVPIDPYVVGCLLGDGTLGHHSVQLTTADKWMVSHIRSKGYEVNKLSAKYQYGFIGMLPHTRELGLQGHSASTKHIPNMYLYNDIDTRIGVLQGLMDTDGYISKDGTVQFTTISEQLAENVRFLVESLGGVARINTKTPTYTYLGKKKVGKLAHTLTIRLNMNPFRMPRKAKKWDIKTVKYPPSRGIADITEIEPQETVCIRVDASDHLYVIQNCIVTHNTIQAIATVEYVWDSYPVLVVCPPNLVLNWKKEYAKWLPNRTVSTITDRQTFPEHPTDVTVIGYSNIAHWEKRLTGFRSLVFDESHYIKSPDAQRTKAAVKIAKNIAADGIVLCLTGTPVTNRPAEYASQLEVIGKLNLFGGRWGFYRRYCAAFRDKWGQWNISGHSNLDELNEKLRGVCYIRRTKEQVLEDLPPVRHAPVWVTGSPAAMTEYYKAERDIVEYLVERAKQIAEELGLSPRSAAVLARMKAEANEHLVKLSVLRRLAARAKMEAVEDFINSHQESGLKVVVAAHHREIVDEIARKYGNLKIQGGMLVEEVESAKSRFQDESCVDAPVIVLSIQAAKTGHTLTASQDVLFVELPWTPADVDQTYSRCHRLGQRGSVTATYLLCSGTIDEYVYDLIERKRGVVGVATDGGESLGGGTGAEIVSLFTAKGFGE